MACMNNSKPPSHGLTSSLAALTYLLCTKTGMERGNGILGKWRVAPVVAAGYGPGILALY